MNVFSDPAKLLPVVGYIGIFVLLGLGKIDFNEAIVLFGVCGIGWILERREVYANRAIWQINDDDIALRIDQRAKIAVAIKRNVFRVREISLRLDLTNGARN